MPGIDTRDIELQLAPFLTCRRWVIAYSGGLDSHVLLHIVARLNTAPPLFALHVNHGLQAQANVWQAHCARVCEQFAVPFLARVAGIESNARRGPEDAARRARYRAFAAELNTDDLLLQAHHADDQAETVLLRLLRGAGTRGLAGMPAERPIGNSRLFRPLLAVHKSDLRRYAEQHALQHVEDKSNFDTSMDRNYLRHEVLPLIRKRWPNFSTSWLRSAAWLQESAAIETALADQDIATAQWRKEQLGASLSLAELRELGSVRAKNVIRHACRLLDLPTPPQQQLLKLLTELADASADARPRIVWENSEARRFGGRVYLLPSLPKVDNSAEYQWSGEVLAVQGVGVVRAIAAHDKGLAKNEVYTIRLRRGGEKFRPAAAARRKSLKKWLQENAVPPWLRDRTPLIYKGDELVAIGELWVAEHHCTRDHAIAIRVDMKSL